MKKHDYLSYCLHQIEQKLDWAESSSWKESEFIELSEMISKASGISISAHTLKRLYGKIEYNEFYNPQRATKNALAKFLGFESWKAYVNDNTIDNNNPEKKEAPALKRALLFLSLSVVALVLIFVFFSNSLFNANKTDKNFDFSFSVVDSIGSVPYTVSVNYDIREIKSDSVYIDFDFVHPALGAQAKKLDKENNLNNFTYQMPGYYTISLMSDTTVLAQKKILATSNGWESYMDYETKRGFWLNNKIAPPDTNGFLYHSKESLANQEFNTNEVFYITNQLFRPFGINGDDFEMKIRFNNSRELGGITCYDFKVQLQGTYTKNHVSLMEEGCSSYSNLKIGNTSVSGIQKNLSTLTFETEIWNELTLVIKEQNVIIKINEKEVYQKKYEGRIGALLGMELITKGTGKIDYVHLRDLESNKTFIEEFD